MSHLRQVVKYLKQSDKWAPQLASDLNVRPGMWAGQKKRRKPAPIIPAEDSPMTCCRFGGVWRVLIIVFVILVFSTVQLECRM
jgi:hypothetical protein